MLYAANIIIHPVDIPIHIPGMGPTLINLATHNWMEVICSCVVLATNVDECTQNSVAI